MNRVISSRVVLRTMLVSLAIVLADRPAIAQDEPADAKPAEAKKEKRFRGRLPAYYRHVVDQKQRETIYKIQEEYEPKIAALRAQLEAIMKERNEKVAAVLTPEQLKKVEELGAAAKAKREKAKERPTKKPAAEAADVE
jgi:Spy/CpxP family protein refolding chaperone